METEVLEIIVKEEPGSSDECSSDFAPKKRLKRTPLTVSEKNIIVNVYKYLEQSSQQNKRNKTTLHTKTADIVGIGVAAVYRILREHARNNIKAPLETKKRPLFSEKISESQKSAIRKKVYSFYENDQLPTGKKALKAVSEDDTLPTFRRTTFHKIMKHLQFKYVRTKARNAVLDKDEMVLWRRNYLDKVMEYRKGNRPIFYVDEGWINLETAPKSNSSTAKNTKKNIIRLNIVHVGNENGFVPNAAEIFETKSKNYEELMTAAHFEWWFENTATKLGENAVVVLDDAPCHSRRVDKIPSNTWTKVSIQEWLRKRDIEFTDEEIKAELLDKVYKSNIQRRTYAVDEIAKKYKVEVLRLPPFHYELNPMVAVLSEVIENVKSKSATLDKAQQLLKVGVEKFAVEKWACHVERAKEEELYFYKLDDIIDDVMDRLYESLNSGSESSDDTGSNSDDE